ncbi:MAG TPA: EamA family transporter [Verrucomicrobiae bacterium]|nr:EamA family transporter [Verrucomicrobiae bacterium]
MRSADALLGRTPPAALLLLAILSIQVGSAVAVTLFPIFGPLGILFLRNALGGLILCILWRTALVPALRRAPGGVCMLGLAMAVQSAAFYEALARIPMGIAVAIEFLGPLGIALAASRRRLDVACVLLAALGLLLLTPSINSSLDPIGVLFALAAGAGWACFVLASRRLGQSVDGGVGLALAMAVSGMLLFAFAGPAALGTLAANPPTLITVAAVTIFSAALPLLFEFIALRRMPPKTYGILVSLEPVAATLIGGAILGDRIGLRAWIAIGLISLASLLVAVGKKPRGDPAPLP